MAAAKKKTEGAELTVVKKGVAFSMVRMTLFSIQPMLQNALTEQALDSLPGGSKKLEKPNLNEMTNEERAAMVMYKGPNGEFGVPKECLFAALNHAGRFVKFDAKRKLSNADMSMLPGSLEILNDFIAFKNQDPTSWVVDKRRAVNPATAGAMCVIRPRFNNWQADVDMKFYHGGGITMDMYRTLLVTAGRESGLGDHRKKGSFGRFIVTNFKVLEELASDHNIEAPAPVLKAA